MIGSYLDGSEGNDRITGGAGSDLLKGGAGNVGPAGLPIRIGSDNHLQVDPRCTQL